MLGPCIAKEVIAVFTRNSALIPSITDLSSPNIYISDMLLPI